MPGHSFSQNDRIEEITRTLNAHDPTSSLIKIFKKKPNFEALGPQFKREHGAPEIGILTYFYHPVLELRLSVLFERNGSD